MSNPKIGNLIRKNIGPIESAYDKLKVSIHSLKWAAKTQGIPEEAVLTVLKDRLGGVLGDKTIEGIWNKQPPPPINASRKVWEDYVRNINVKEMSISELTTCRNKLKTFEEEDHEMIQTLIDELRRRNRFYEMK